jgi:hypothetical protein
MAERKDDPMNRRFLAVLIAASLLVPASAFAYSHGSASESFGPQLGFSSDPSQVVFGGHMDFADIAPSLDFVPSIDVGVGDNVTVFSFNGDFHYRFDINSHWQPYAGGGVALHAFSWDTGFGHTSDTVGGGNLIVGADVPTQRGSRFYVEGRFGLGDGPSFKALAGWNFGMHR